jgi:hypothetical protein
VGREGGVELGQSCEHLGMAGRRQRQPRTAPLTDRRPVEPERAGGDSPVLVEVVVGDGGFRRAGRGRHEPLLGRRELPAGRQQLEPLDRVGSVGSAGGDDRP